MSYRWRRIWKFSFSWRTLFLLAVIAGSLQVLSIFITLKKDQLLLKNIVTKLSPTGCLWEINLNEEDQLIERVREDSILDDSREFKILSNAVISSFFTKFYGHYDDADITLVTQCSYQGLQYLPRLSQRWKGPISVTVFLFNHELRCGLRSISFLRSCYADVRNNCNFNIVIPNKSLYLNRDIELIGNDSCKEFSKSFSKRRNQNYEFTSISYPNNLLRNVAWKAAVTSHILMLDIDILPSGSLRSNFHNFLNSQKSKENTLVTSSNAVWVLPAYEVKLGLRMPENKTELLSLVEENLARPFYDEVCSKCQNVTDYRKWTNLISVDSDLSPIFSQTYEVCWRNLWEPFFIADINTPVYDERFRQYGFNRISQVCELHFAGYRFFVLDSAFVVHEGFKRPGEFHHSKQFELSQNGLLFSKFKEELKLKYPYSGRGCF